MLEIPLVMLSFPHFSPIDNLLFNMYNILMGQNIYKKKWDVLFSQHADYFNSELIKTLEFYKNTSERQEALNGKLKNDNAFLKSENKKLKNRNDFLAKDRDAIRVNLLSCMESEEYVTNKLDVATVELGRIQGLLQTKTIELRDANKEIDRLNKEVEDAMKKVRDALEKQKEADEKIKDFERRLKEMEKDLTKIQNENYRLKELDKTMVNSDNSNMPTSKLVYIKSPNRKKSNRKLGGQVGHTVHKSKLRENPTKIIRFDVKKQPSGAIEKVDEDGNTYYATQFMNIKISNEIIENRYYVSENGSNLDPLILNQFKVNPVAYSSEFKSFVLYLSTKGAIALKRLCTIIDVLSDGVIKLKESTIVKWQKEFAEKSEDIRQGYLNELFKSRYICVDETGQRIEGKQAWAHVLTNDKIVYLLLTQKRADTENGPVALLQGYLGTLIHDHFRTYYKYLSVEDYTHAECNAHIIRYLQHGIDYHQSKACEQLKALLIEMNNEKHKLMDQGITEIDKGVYEEYKRKYINIIDEELERYNKEHKKIPKKYEAKYIKTFRRMKKFVKEHLLFLADFDVPFTNNSAEQKIRCLKIKAKVSGKYASVESGNWTMALQSVIQTETNLGHDVKQVMIDIFDNKLCREPQESQMRDLAF